MATNYWYKQSGHCGSNFVPLIYRGDDSLDALERSRQCRLELPESFFDQFGDCDYFEITFKVEPHLPGSEIIVDIRSQLDGSSRKIGEMRTRHSKNIYDIKRLGLGDHEVYKQIMLEKKTL